MKKIAVLGGGKIGSSVAQLLASAGEYTVTIFDQHPGMLGWLQHPHLAVAEANLAESEQVKRALKGQDYAVSTAPYYLNKTIAEIAASMGVHYFDVTEDVATTKAVRDLDKGAKGALIPQCGLAPGFISIAAASVAKKFEVVHDIEMRVGALPEFPTNALKYNLTWSTDGLINEYCNPCEAVMDGKLTLLQPLEGLEHFLLDGSEYEAFNTSGGIGSMAETWEGKARNISYKTVRYPGHCEIMQILLQDLGLKDKRDVLKKILEDSIPSSKQDVVLVFVTVTGLRNKRLAQENFLRKIYARELLGRSWSAIELTTATALAAMVDLHAEGTLPQKGFVKQEDVTLEQFLNNRFGQYYAG
ncbi:MAG: saccharopine dehydrogenase C-terminal domain-containing protein [Dongiaceae bacterium]